MTGTFALQKNIARLLVLASILFGLTLVAQPVYAIDVTITALVEGCGDGIIQLGEQCDGGNLNGNTCSTIGGYTGGTLSCTSVCTYNVLACTTSGGGGGGGGRRPTVQPDTPDVGYIIFSGIASPNSQVEVYANGQVLTAGFTDSQGNFTITYIDPPTKQFNFVFVNTESQTGIQQSLPFSILVTEDLVTRVTNIIFPTVILPPNQELTPIQIPNVTPISPNPNPNETEVTDDETTNNPAITPNPDPTGIINPKPSVSDAQSVAAIIKSQEVFKKPFESDELYRDQMTCMSCLVVRRDVDSKGVTKQKIIKLNAVSRQDEFRIPLSRLDPRPVSDPGKLPDVEGISLLLFLVIVAPLVVIFKKFFFL